MALSFCGPPLRCKSDWVEDLGQRYDLLVVVVDEKHAQVLQFWAVAEMRLPAEPSSDERLRTPINFLVHTQAWVDEALTRGLVRH